MLNEKGKNVLVYISILSTPIIYVVILTLIVMQKALRFSDFSDVLMIYFGGAIVTYLLSIPYVINALKNEVNIRKVLIRLAIYQLPTLITFVFSLFIIITSYYVIN